MRFLLFWVIFVRFRVFFCVLVGCCTFLRVFAYFSALGVPLVALGALLGALGTLRGALGALLGALGRSWGALEALLERSWTLLGRSWGALKQKYGKNIVAARLWGCFWEEFWKGFGHLERPCKEPSFT